MNRKERYDGRLYYYSKDERGFAYKLAKAIHVPTSRIQDILHDRRKITADTSLRLAKYFGVSDNYFLNIQNDIDLRELKVSMAAEIEEIRPYQTNKLAEVTVN